MFFIRVVTITCCWFLASAGAKTGGEQWQEEETQQVKGQSHCCILAGSISCIVLDFWSVCVCVCVQTIWRQVYEAHDLCMSVWTFLFLDSLTGWCVCACVCWADGSTVSPGSDTLLMSQLWVKEKMARNGRWREAAEHLWSFPLWIYQLSYCPFPGDHSKEIPGHHRKDVSFIHPFTSTTLFQI